MLDGTSTCSPLHCRNLSPHGKFLPVVQHSQSSAIPRTTLTHTSASPVVWPSLVEALLPGGHHRTLPRPGGTWPCALGSAACTWTEIPAQVPSTSPPTSAQSVSSADQDASGVAYHALHCKRERRHLAGAWVPVFGAAGKCVGIK